MKAFAYTCSSEAVMQHQRWHFWSQQRCLCCALDHVACWKAGCLADCSAEQQKRLNPEGPVLATLIYECMQGVSVTLDPLGKDLGPLLAILDDVIQSNLPKRKPKVAKGARDFGPREMTIRKPLFKASPALHLLLVKSPSAVVWCTVVQGKICTLCPALGPLTTTCNLCCQFSGLTHEHIYL